MASITPVDFVNFSRQTSSTFTLPVLKNILFGGGFLRLENVGRLLLFLIFTPLIILAQLTIMALLKPIIVTLELLASLLENTLAENLTMIVSLGNSILLLPINEENKKDKAIYEDIFTEIYKVSYDSGIDSSEFSDSQSEAFEKPERQLAIRHSLEKGKVKCHQTETEREDLSEPHDAWVLETGKGAFEPNFKEEGETFYLVFWYWVCNNLLM